MTFEVNIQSPFKSSEDKFQNQTSDEALRLFKSIDWKALWQTILASGSSQESDYYYYEVMYRNYLGEEYMLHISCTVGEDVSLRYFRPKTIVKTVWFKKKEVLDPKFETVIDEVNVSFAEECLKAFLKENNTFLENRFNRDIS